MAQRDDGLISESPCETGVEGRQIAGARSGLGRWNDAAWIAGVLAFFAIQYRATVFLGRHWLFGDNSFQNFPWHYFVWDRVRHGGLADPCLEMSLGFPLLAEPQVQALYPFNTALWPIDDPFVSFTLKLLLHMLAATIGMYVLARQLGRSPMASAAAAIVLGGSSFMVYRIVHAPLLFGLAWLPWIVLLFMRARLHGSRPAFVGLVGCCAMQVLSGQPHDHHQLAAALTHRRRARLATATRRARPTAGPPSYHAASETEAKRSCADETITDTLRCIDARHHARGMS